MCVKREERSAWIVDLGVSTVRGWTERGRQEQGEVEERRATGREKGSSVSWLSLYPNTRYLIG